MNDQGQCEDCAVGTYQPMGSTSLCLPCPEGETTADPKSVSVDACIRKYKTFFYPHSLLRQ